MAVLATESNKKVLAENIRQAQFKKDKVKKDAEKIAEALKDVNLTIGTKAGENGKIFGAENALQMAEEVMQLGYEVVSRKMSLDGERREVGGGGKEGERRGRR